MELELNVGPQLRAHLAEIARTMAELFPITEAEATGRINRQWRHVTEFGEPSKPSNRAYVETPTFADMVLRDSPTYWAKEIYYGHDSFWWLGEDGLEPVPYP